MKYDSWKCDGYQNAQLIDRDNDAGGSFLQGSVAAEPGGTGGKSRQTDEEDFFSWNIVELWGLSFYKNHDPCHKKDNRCTDGSSEIWVDAADADLAKNGGQAGKNGG